MPLTHVCMWADQSWKKITAYEAAKLYPYGASAHSGLFMCELCGQYVTLTNGSYQSRHFRHSAKEQNKDCEDRSDLNGYSYYFKAEAHDLPIRITIINLRQFKLELGLIPVSDTLMEELAGHTILIDGGDSARDKYKYSVDRIIPEQVNYLPIGTEPKKEYKVFVKPDVRKISLFWPNRIEGIDPRGTLFDGRTGKKLQYDSDVVVNREYFLLVRGYGISYPREIEVNELCAATCGYATWKVFRVVATKFSEQTARFFLDHHCRLTDEPVKMYPIWPMHINSPYVVYHNAKEIYVYFHGNAETNLSPKGTIKPFPGKDPKVLLISASDRQQLLSAGRTRVLKYTYFWQQELKQKAELPQVRVNDFSGNLIEEGISDKLPLKKSLTIIPQVDGCLELFKDGIVVEKYRVDSGKEFLIDNIKYGCSIKVYQGCDLVWEITFQKDKKRNQIKDEELLEKLEKCKGKCIVIDQSTYGVLAKRLNGMPKSKRWLYSQKRLGYLDENAFRILKSLFTLNKGDTL